MKTRHLVIVLLVLSIISMFIGVIDIGVRDIFSLNAADIKVIYMSRLPRLISIVIAGMAMSIAGLIMQQISHNKFVSPTTATTMDSAKMGVLFSMILFKEISSMNRMIFAFVFALVGTFLFMKMLDRIKIKNTVFIPLIGIMMGKIIDSITTFFAYRFDMVQNINIWLQGDFSMITKGRYELLYISIPLLILSFIYANRFTVAGMGKDFATNLGLNYDLVVNIGLGIVAMLTALVIVTAGSIPFLGLVVPNIVTMIKGDNMRDNIGFTGILGSVFLLACDILGRLVVYPYEVSISLTVGIVGSLIFLYYLGRGDELAE